MDETTMTERTYNGWSNYETWTVSLWLDNERHSHKYWRRHATEHRQAAPTCERVVDGIWSAEDAAKFNLADQLKEETLDGSPLTMPSLYSDLLTAALGEVNWAEIAANLLADVAEQEIPASDVFGDVISSYGRAQAIADSGRIPADELRTWPGRGSSRRRVAVEPRRRKSGLATRGGTLTESWSASRRGGRGRPHLGLVGRR